MPISPLAGQTVLDGLAHMHEASMPFLANILVPDETKDVRGVVPRGQYRLVTSGIPCRTSPYQAPQTNQIADAIEGRRLWLVELPRATGIAVNHRLIITGEIDQIGFTQTLDVVGVLGPRANEVVRGVIGREHTSAP